MFQDQTYDVLVIGGGQAGIPLAHALAGKRLRVALAERKNLGGSCVNFGCTPTKAVIASARVAQLARRGDEFGIAIGTVRPDLVAVLARARDIVMQSRTALRGGFRKRGAATLLAGHARFEGRAGRYFRLRVGRETVQARQVVINTGTRTRVPPVPGLSNLSYLDAENWLDRPELPKDLVVLGGGYTGLEMGQFYRRMGSRVTVVEQNDEIVKQEDAEVSGALRQFLESEEIAFRLSTRVIRVRRSGRSIELSLEHAGKKSSLQASQVFVATGRQPNTDDLGLDAVGLKTSRDGFLEVNRRLATGVRGIWAAGDVRGGPMFTHTAWDDYRVLLSQIAGDRSRTTDRVVPYAIYTDPQLGRVGLTETAARKNRRAVRVARFELQRNGKAREIGEPGGFIKVLSDRRSGQILGAAVVGVEAAELVHLYVTLMNARASYRVIRDAVYVHPTLAEAAQSAVAALDPDR